MEQSRESLKEPLIKSGRIFCEMKFVSFLIKKLLIVLSIGHFIVENGAVSAALK